MPADAGAERIDRLLNQRVQSLTEDLATLAEAARDAHENPYGVMSQSGIEALTDIRRYYRRLRTRIAGIQTSDGKAKSGALEALDAIDTAFGSYEQGLELGISPPALPKVKSAERKARQAKSSMQATVARLGR